MQTLITPVEIISNCGLPSQFPAFDLRTIRAVEYQFFRKYLTTEVYNTLLGMLVDYTLLTEWNSTTTYVTGNLVKLAGRAYIATEGSINFKPPNSKWDAAPKLSTNLQQPCLSQIWCAGFLSDCLSWGVLLSRLPLIKDQIHAEGIGNIATDRFQNSTDTGYQTLYNGVKNMYNTCLENHKAWLTDTKCLTEVASSCEIISQPSTANSDYIFLVA